MKKLIAIIGIGLALCATASTQTSKEYVDKKDAEVLERAKTFTEEHVIDFEDWTRSEIGKIEETADQANTNANLALEKSSRASEDAERAVKNMYHGSARPLPPYLHAIDFDDTYPDDAAWYYALPHDYSGCSAVRDGGFLYRNYDWRLDDAAEFVVRMSAGVGRFASIGVANCGTNLTEQIVTSGKWSRFYRCLPGRTVDGINENGVVCEINVVDTDPPESSGGDIHPLAAVRWALDNGTSAEMVATNLAVRVMWPSGWRQNFHWMIADAAETWIVENGVASNVTEVAAKLVMTNFEILPDTYSGMGKERYNLLLSSACCITNAWYTRAYRRETNPTWVSDLAEVIAYTNDIFTAWAAHPKEYFRGQLNGGKPWWQTVHTSIYDITNRTLRIAVQERGDWYTFALPSVGAVKSVNGKDGEVVLNAADVHALPDTYTPPHDDTKVDKEDGKGLSQNDYTDADKAEVAKVKDKADEFTAWEFGGGAARVSGLTMLLNKMVERDPWQLLKDGTLVAAKPDGSDDDVRVEFEFYNPDVFPSSPIITRKRVLRTGDAATPGQVQAVDDKADSALAAVSGLTSQVSSLSSSKRDIGDNDFLGDLGLYEGDLNIFSPFGVYAHFANIGGHETLDEGWSNIIVSISEATETLPEYLDRSISTNNPVFVDAVRNTPSPSPGEEDDPPWGTYGTLGAAIAGIIAALKLMVKKITCGTLEVSPTNGVADLSDLFSESNTSLKGVIAAKSIPTYSSSATYEIGEIVLHDGAAYKCTTAITVAENWTASHWTLASNADVAARLNGFKADGKSTDAFAADLLGKPVAKEKLQTIEDEPTVTSGAVTLKDGAASTVAIGSLASLDITFDEARNGGLRLCELYITGVTAGTIPDLTFDAAVNFVGTGDSFPACEAGINYFVFAEVAANLWKVTRETLKSITTPTPVAA